MAIPEFYKTISQGSSGPDVGLIQQWLNAVRSSCTAYGPLEVDGKYGRGCAAAAKQFQAMRGLSADGIVGHKTWDALYQRFHEITGATVIYPGIVMHSGMSGAAVGELQHKLSQAGFACSADGKYGAKTAAEVKLYQTSCGLKADGQVGKVTWECLFGE